MTNPFAFVSTSPVGPTKRRFGISIAALVAVAALTAVLVAAASAEPSGKAAKGGTYRVGWESSFGWTEQLRPDRRVPRGTGSSSTRTSCCAAS